MQSSAAKSAAQTQAQAAEQGQALQAQEAQNALNFNQQQWATSQNNLAPFVGTGQQALGQLSTAFANGGPQWTQQFQAPTAAQAEQMPGYQFALQQGENAINASAAARGNVLNPGTSKALGQYAEGLASQNYQNVFNNALTGYQQNYNQFQQGQANIYNRLMGITGVGQASAANAANLSQSAANTGANIALTSGAQQSQELNNAAAAIAAGQVGSANAYGNALNGLGGSATNLLLLSQMMGSGYGGSGAYDPSGDVIHALGSDFGNWG